MSGTFLNRPFSQPAVAQTRSRTPVWAVIDRSSSHRFGHERETHVRIFRETFFHRISHVCYHLAIMR
jgi:deoxyxylulose-5-phosphate synthase